MSMVDRCWCLYDKGGQEKGVVHTGKKTNQTFIVIKFSNFNSLVNYVRIYKKIIIIFFANL